MTKYKQIADDILAQITRGELRVGKRLPSIQELSEKYACSKGTVIKAYDALAQRHIIYAKPQSGYYVSHDFVKDNTVLDGFDMVTGNPHIDAFPIVNFKHAMNVAVELYRGRSLDLEIRGSETLREALIHYLSTNNIYVKQENLFFSLGVTHVLSILCAIPFPNGKTKILIEEPTFSFTVSQMKAFNMDVLTIPRDEMGIDLEQLESLFKHESIKFFYTIPRNHNPLGTYLPYHQRKRIVELAHKYDVYLVENDYFSESFSIPKYDTLYYLSEFKHCIYLKSYTKLLPYIRIGYAIIPDDLIHIYTQGINQSYFTSYYMPDLVSQATLESSLKTNILDTMATTVSETLHKKIEIYNQIVSQWNTQVLRPIPMQCGFYATVIVNPTISAQHLVEHLKAVGVYIKTNEESFYHYEHYDNSIRIAISRVHEDSLKEALTLLYDTTLTYMDTYRKDPIS